MIVGGLFVFETITSIDNAIINAEVLRTMKEKHRRWFLLWGFFLSPYSPSGVFCLAYSLGHLSGTGLVGAFTSTFQQRPSWVQLGGH